MTNTIVKNSLQQELESLELKRKCTCDKNNTEFNRCWTCRRIGWLYRELAEIRRIEEGR